MSGNHQSPEPAIIIWRTSTTSLQLAADAAAHVWLHELRINTTSWVVSGDWTTPNSGCPAASQHHRPAVLRSHADGCDDAAAQLQGLGH